MGGNSGMEGTLERGMPGGNGGGGGLSRYGVRPYSPTMGRF